MKLPLYQVDAFADAPFTGNPAAVVPLDSWLSDNILQAIAQQNNLSETAFYIKLGRKYQIRWFTPTVEVDLCGHATLAAAHVLFAEQQIAASEIVFSSRSGDLSVGRLDDTYTLNFPSEQAELCSVPKGLSKALDMEVYECYFNTDYLVVLESQQVLNKLAPDFTLLAKLPARGVIVTAPGDEVDFVCRFFAPAVGVNEDPVTGSAFTKLVPYWVARTNKLEFQARQISSRGGNVCCSLQKDRVLIAGRARTYLRGFVEI